MKNFTTGPWETFVSPEWPRYLAVCSKSARMDEIAVVICSPQERDNGCPNADLIAAAPELYEGLMEAAVNFCNSCRNLEKHSKTGFECTAGENECPIQKWRKALKKAKGIKK